MSTKRDRRVSPGNLHQEKVGFHTLSQDQVKDIHHTALEVLERTGVVLRSKEARDLLSDAGCHVDGDRVHFPSGLVEWAVEAAPSQMTLFNRDGSETTAIGGRNVTFGPGPTLLNIRDPETGNRRSFSKQDVRDVARLCDALDNIDWVMGFGTIDDVPHEHSDRHEFEAMVKNTTKPIIVWSYSREGMRDIIDMASFVRGGREELAKRPFIISLTAPISPLIHNRDACEKVLLAAEYGVPVIHAPAIQGGSNAPVTIAGQVAQGTAENLSGLVLSQLKRKGLPYFFGGVISIMDMKTAILAYGAPEKELATAAYMDIADYYNLPTWGTAGCTDSKVFDSQSAIEGTLSTLFSALSGANLVHDVGYMESGSTGSLEQIVMVNEAIGMAEKFIDGIEVTDETLALDVIDQVGHGGDYMSHEHTMDNFREATWEPTLLDRSIRDTWKKEGAKTLEERANDKVVEILDQHEPPSLPEEVVARIDEVVEGL
ncbi:trimethylamine methyltransferase family protein [Candidatus Bipolaricaulota bacterium]|nr:trimethylamine methyltransferase family protein [Candidatus Bipolaricaulota bacterium]MBS3792612.1 trimethylamine methyltransferase family protein [Candidatus Bipolaricaulota bacterium]